ncbi:hypothetical protein [Pantoea piersonii]|uniref:hypothetical protein n=1 Tax=Pantoea TaxID=53335 RepID=UPI0028AAD71B|nr:hypothetical protein [Pantoea piersonii]
MPVKEASDFSAWMTPALSFCGALGAVALTHHFTRRRERLTAEEKRQEDRLFICIELITVLEDFTLHCADASHDKGKRVPEPPLLNLLLVPAMPEPVLDFSVVKGEWKVLPAALMYKLRELPVNVRQTARMLEHLYALNDPYHIRFFNYRRLHYARAGLRAIWLSARLRRLCKLPASKLVKFPDSPYHDMRRVRKSERSFSRDRKQ